MRHNDIEVREVAENLTNFNYAKNFQATKELMELFDEISRIPLITWKDYVKTYDDNFYTFQTWDELVKSEVDQSDGFTEDECVDQINISIWKLPCGWYVQCV